MIVPEEGAVLRIESYKYGEHFHRMWKKSVVLKSGEPLIIANENVEVVEADGRKWRFPGLTIGCFHRTEWFHTLVVFGEDEHFRFSPTSPLPTGTGTGCCPTSTMTWI